MTPMALGHPDHRRPRQAPRPGTWLTQLPAPTTRKDTSRDRGTPPTRRDSRATRHGGTLIWWRATYLCENECRPAAGRCCRFGPGRRCRRSLVPAVQPGGERCEHRHHIRGGEQHQRDLPSRRVTRRRTPGLPAIYRPDTRRQADRHRPRRIPHRPAAKAAGSSQAARGVRPGTVVGAKGERPPPEPLDGWHALANGVGATGRSCIHVLPSGLISEVLRVPIRPVRVIMADVFRMPIVRCGCTA